MKIYFHKKCGVFEACKKVTDFFDTLKKASADGGSFFMANDSNFDRNPVRGGNYGSEGSAVPDLGGATTALGGALLYPWGQQ